MVGQAPRSLLLQVREEGLGFQLGRLAQEALGRRPDRRQRVLSSPPVVLGLKLLRGLSRVEVPCALWVDSHRPTAHFGLRFQLLGIRSSVVGIVVS